MKITILGAAGVRTPLIIQAMAKRLAAIDELALMDTDAQRLELIGALTERVEQEIALRFKITRTTDALAALEGADFVITTFRVGGIAGRVIDERVPLSHGILGQETTGPGGFAMGLRTIPVLMDYLKLMRTVCPHAWLINFTNPSGMMTEAIIRSGGWERTIGICDAPDMMRSFAALALNAPPDEVYLDYFGLNHLGWVRAIRCQGKDYVPQFIEMIKAAGGIPGLPFATDLIDALGMIPNEYLYYYYHAHEAVENILKAPQTRGEQLLDENERLNADLMDLRREGRSGEMFDRYKAYILQRGYSYMANETDGAYNVAGLDQQSIQNLSEEGYANVALGVIEALTGSQPHVMILNVPNRGAIAGFPEDTVVEIPVMVANHQIQPLHVGAIPEHCLGLMLQVKAYERYTIAAAIEGSYQKALTALNLHPLVRDHAVAKVILDEYRIKHGDLFPQLA